MVKLNHKINLTILFLLQIEGYIRLTDKHATRPDTALEES